MQGSAPVPAAGSAPVIDDVVRTIRDLVARHPSLSLAVVASEPAGPAWHLRVTHTGSGVQVTLDHDGPPTPAASTAARLAELLREHPTILDILDERS
ncbi:hypothetical protein Daura_01675 [Dactylosporangium aurantiacum]|uniref:Uncharacterized protein n=1 Tax=Dactylosporangium aurantiacum TaxID=35754 RepID=A0A9Q9IFZ9_9ACTN|nr:hypothetical protein [Dactylosporangium aurantiacum]UWZ55021.1 hypothetical protein Daura_01675 [Dactylosporangium aurantiacum]